MERLGLLHRGVKAHGSGFTPRAPVPGGASGYNCGLRRIQFEGMPWISDSPKSS
jgi:hypothetical protein